METILSYFRCRVWGLGCRATFSRYSGKDRGINMVI